MDLTNPSRVGPFLLLWTSSKLSTLSGTLLFFLRTDFGWPPSLLCSLDLNLFFLISALTWSFKITESVEVFRKDPFLALYFSLFSSMIFVLLCLLPSVVLFMPTIWPFGPLPQSLLLCRPHKELCFDWSAGLSTGVFLSIRANVKPPSSRWIPTKLTSNLTSSYSTSLHINLTPTFVVITFDRTLPFQTCICAES